MSVIEDGNRQVTDKALMEVFRRMEPLIRAMLGGSGGIRLVTSDDGSVTVVGPTGPTVDLAVTDPGWRFDTLNDGGFGRVDFNDTFNFGGDVGERGALFKDTTTKGIVLYATHVGGTPQPTLFEFKEGYVRVASLTAVAGAVQTVWDDGGIVSLIGTGTKFDVNGPGGALLSTDEATGVTTGIFDGTFSGTLDGGGA